MKIPLIHMHTFGNASCWSDKISIHRILNVKTVIQIGW
jgi:hypothetical protein